ncbi:protease inhibitor Inh/omp19 family protein [Allorhizobium sp. BGMRC 0089]|uniref:protease inhibitor Inh/omp19 family protein n=1 Tax=Allorhizobium sonneratiae TaxID=2934936 RepID=UPI00203365D2|nr:protease inhibitor Inh/omp19 family protein [Allorhizobium sonneratiae]MCM2293415.1 protease inhibitor Inh/omp19 family protein [Allorhizobium sonneratiae]
MKLKLAATGLFVIMALTGCQRTSSDYGSSSLPPLAAQPVPNVQSSQLPPPGASSSQFPTAPATQQQSAALTPNAGAPATAQDFTKDQLVGSWHVTSGATSCDMFLTLTNLGGGSRGGTRGCVGPLTTMGAWDVANKQLQLKDRDGNVIGTLYKMADNNFSGTTSAGQPISLSR